MADAATIPYEELTSEQKLRAFWMDFCQADPVPPEFTDDMEAAGFMFLDDVDEDDLQTAFASELGIEPGGRVWRLTDEGRRIVNLPEPSHLSQVSQGGM